MAGVMLPRLSGGQQEIHGAIAEYGCQDDEEDSQQRIQVDSRLASGATFGEMSEMPCLEDIHTATACVGYWWAHYALPLKFQAPNRCLT